MSGRSPKAHSETSLPPRPLQMRLPWAPRRDSGKPEEPAGPRGSAASDSRSTTWRRLGVRYPENSQDSVNPLRFPRVLMYSGLSGSHDIHHGNASPAAHSPRACRPGAAPLAGLEEAPPSGSMHARSPGDRQTGVFVLGSTRPATRVGVGRLAAGRTGTQERLQTVAAEAGRDDGSWTGLRAGRRAACVCLDGFAGAQHDRLWGVRSLAPGIARPPDCP